MTPFLDVVLIRTHFPLKRKAVPIHLNVPPPFCPGHWVVWVIALTPGAAGTDYGPHDGHGDDDQDQPQGKQPQGVESNLVGEKNE